LRPIYVDYPAPPRPRFGTTAALGTKDCPAHGRFGATITQPVEVFSGKPTMLLEALSSQPE